MKRKPLEIEFDGDDLVAAVQDTVKLYREGRLGELRVRERKPLKPLKPAQIRAIHKKWGASQAIFADILNVPKKTYISWESGYKNPSGAALKLLKKKSRRPFSLPDCSDGEKVFSRRRPDPR